MFFILLTNLNNTVIRQIHVKQRKLSGLLTLSANLKLTSKLYHPHYFSCFIYFVFLLPLALFMLFFFSFVILCTDGIYMQNCFSLVVIYVHMQ